MYKKYIKRLLDIIFSLVFIIVFCWIYIILAALVALKLGSPVIFKQERVGKDEKSFYMYKFRSMIDAYDENGKPLPDDLRLTKFGRLLRSSSLDELPEVFLILSGKMSIIGPRPLLVDYLPYYTPEEHIRHSVRPGLTGLAQVNGRNAISWDDKLKYDVDYCKSISFLGDISILLKTIKKVLIKEGTLEGKEKVNARLDDYRRGK
ncbi:MAG: sugar transferase [Gammaproteobacteria bacterium]|nr:sugar transferase [Gammaproteobacteria bacterium]